MSRNPTIVTEEDGAVVFKFNGNGWRFELSIDPEDPNETMWLHVVDNKASGGYTNDEFVRKLKEALSDV